MTKVIPEAQCLFECIQLENIFLYQMLCKHVSVIHCIKESRFSVLTRNLSHFNIRTDIGQSNGYKREKQQVLIRGMALSLKDKFFQSPGYLVSFKVHSALFISRWWLLVTYLSLLTIAISFLLFFLLLYLLLFFLIYVFF